MPIRIHCWGGLGSQLYAWALFERLSIRFPKRKLRLVLHTSGVTRRASDLNDLFSVDELITLDDFVHPKKLGNADRYDKKYEAVENFISVCSDIYFILLFIFFDELYISRVFLFDFRQSLLFLNKY